MPTYEIQAYNGEPHTRIVIAADQTEALIWLLRHDSGFEMPSSIHIAVIDDVVDLTKASERKVKNAPDPITAINKAARESHLLVEEESDALTVAQAVRLTGLKASGVHSRKYRNVFQSAGHGMVTRASVQAWLDQGGTASEKRDTAAIVRKMNEARLAKRAEAPVQRKAEKAKPARPGPEEDMVREDKLAKELGMDLVELRILKRQGDVAGGYGWVDRIAFERYMKTR